MMKPNLELFWTLLVRAFLSLKGHGFCLKIDKQVDQFLNPQETVPVEQIRHSVNDTTDTISETPVSTEEIPRDITLDRTIENNKDIPSSVVDTKEGNSSELPKEQSVLDQISPDINNEKNEPNDVELQETEVEEVEMELGGNSNDMMVIEKNNEEKISIYDEILEAQPNDVEALTYKADVLLDMDEIKWALSLTNEAIEQDNQYSFAYWQRACAHASLGNLDEALDDLQRALELSPSFSEELQSETFLAPLREDKRFKALL